MPRKFQGISTPDGFTKYAARKFKRKIPGLKNKYQFTNWMLRKHMKKSSVKKMVIEFKRSR